MPLNVEAKPFEDRVASAIRTLTVCVFILAAALGVAVAFAVWGFVNASGATSGVSRDQARVASLAHTANTTAALVARERREAILLTCRQQNGRHKNTISALHHILGPYEHRLKDKPAQLRQIRASQASTTLLINALAPYENCQQQVAQLSRP